MISNPLISTSAISYIHLIFIELMQSGSRQNLSGRAFEYAVLSACLEVATAKGLTVEVEQTNALVQAKRAFDEGTAESRAQLMEAARKGVQAFTLMEPRFSNPRSQSDVLKVFLQNDAAGQAGDVRDLVVLRQEQDWQTGISAKHNSKFIKSARLSDASGFAQRWLQTECSETFRTRVTEIFRPIQGLIGTGTSWNDFGQERKHDMYGHLVKAFKEELLLLYSIHGEIIPARFLQFLLGSNDFYKVLRIDSTTQVQPFNLNGSLGKQAGSIRPVTKPPRLPVPTRILSLDIVSGTTLHLYCDKGWQVALRVHNKDTALAASLGMEAHLIGHPSELFTLLIPWSISESIGVLNEQ